MWHRVKHSRSKLPYTHCISCILGVSSCAASGIAAPDNLMHASKSCVCLSFYLHLYTLILFALNVNNFAQWFSDIQIYRIYITYIYINWCAGAPSPHQPLETLRVIEYQYNRFVVADAHMYSEKLHRPSSESGIYAPSGVRISGVVYRFAFSFFPQCVSQISVKQFVFKLNLG